MILGDRQILRNILILYYSCIINDLRILYIWHMDHNSVGRDILGR